MTNVEIREIRAADMVVANEGKSVTFTGYAAVFDSPSEPLPFIETIAPGAFARSLKSRNDVRMYVNHDDNMVLASTRSGTLRLQEDAKGLRVQATMPDTTYARDLVELMRSNVVDSMSFGFSVPRGGDSWNEDGSQRRLNEVRLHEVSVVTGVPAYAATSAMVRKVQSLATRAATTPDMLAEAMNALIDGNLSDDQAALLRAVVDKVAPDTSPDAPLDVLRQRLDLAAKAI
jgi:HK97 family phage prohead protease